MYITTMAFVWVSMVRRATATTAASVVQQLAAQNVARPLLYHRLGFRLFDAFSFLHLLGKLALIIPKLANGILKLTIIMQHFTHIIHIILRNNCNANIQFWVSSRLNFMFLAYSSKRQSNQGAVHHRRCHASAQCQMCCPDAFWWHCYPSQWQLPANIIEWECN